VDEKGLFPMSEVRAGLLKIRRWKMLADVVDRGVLITGLVALGTLVVMYFVANNIIGVSRTLGATISKF
jgi:hypothetical protein